MAIKNVQAYTAGEGYGSPLNIRRGNPNPLDNSEVWNNVSEAQAYAKSDPTAYVGQVISYFYTDADGIEKVQLAQIINSQGDLQPILKNKDIDLQEVTEKDIDSIIFSVFG